MQSIHCVSCNPYIVFHAIYALCFMQSIHCVSCNPYIVFHAIYSLCFLQSLPIPGLRLIRACIVFPTIHKLCVHSILHCISCVSCIALFNAFRALHCFMHLCLVSALTMHCVCIG